MAETRRQELFDAFCAYLLEVVKRGGFKTVDEEGEEKIIPLDASFAQCIRAFLKDFPPEEGAMWGDASVQEYLDKLPFTKTRSKKDIKRATNSPAS